MRALRRRGMDSSAANANAMLCTLQACQTTETRPVYWAVGVAKQQEGQKDTSYEAEEKSHNNVRCTIIVGIHRTTRLIWLAELWQNVGSSNLSAAIFSPWSSFDTLSAKPANMVRNLLVRKDSQFDCRFPRLQKLNFLHLSRRSSVITSKLTFISIFYYTAFRPYTMLHREEEEFDGFGPGTST